MIRIFVSSVQKEFEQERLKLFEWITADPFLGKFFELFLFEKLPALDNTPQQVFLDEIGQCEIYLGILGKEYGFVGKQGVSVTEEEFDEASRLHKQRLVFVTDHVTAERDERQAKFIQKAQAFLVRRKFSDYADLKSLVYASLVRYLGETGKIQSTPFDAAVSGQVDLAHIDPEKVADFVRLARSKRGFKLQATAPFEEVLSHLNLIKEGKPNNAAILLFGHDPSRFFPSAEVRCEYHLGAERKKPIASYKVFKGTVFELVDQAEDFILSKLDYQVETRSEETSIPGKFEIPREVVAEAIVNAIAHRDYTHNGSVQVMLFKDRLEIRNPGSLPLGWTVEKLKKLHTSVPRNLLLAEPMYQTGYIERLGTGTSDMVAHAKEAGLVDPVFAQEDTFNVTIFRKGFGVTDQAPPKHPPSTLQVSTKHRPSTAGVPQEYRRSTVEVQNLLKALVGEMSRKEIQKALQLKHEGNFRENYLEPALKKAVIQMKYPDSPKHPKQRYFLTEKGQQLLTQLLKR
jgi:predicted HTH transcriptional regulator